MPVTGLSGDRPAVLRYSSRIRTEPRKRILRLCAATQCRLHFAHLRTLVLEWGDWTGYFWLGRGVDLFFCLSGFFLTSPVLTPLQTSNTSAGTPQPSGCAGFDSPNSLLVDFSRSRLPWVFCRRRREQALCPSLGSHTVDGRNYA